MKTVVIGAVNSTKILIEEMLACDFPIDYIFSLDDEGSENISGYYPLHELAQKYNVPWKKYKKINDLENIEIIKSVKPDYIFAIGFSQLVSKKILEIPTKGVIGCHPADLPNFRGRAVLVWQILLGIKKSKVTMFMMDEGADTGDIIEQEPFCISDDDYAIDVAQNADDAIRRLCKKSLPKILHGNFQLKKQKNDEATICLRRTPADGKIDWCLDASNLYRLIRATSSPYPGAFSYYDGIHKIIIWRAHVEENHRYYGFSGQIAEISNEKMIIILQNGLLVVEEYDNVDNVKIFVGHRLGDKR